MKCQIKNLRHAELELGDLTIIFGKKIIPRQQAQNTYIVTVFSTK